MDSNIGMKNKRTLTERIEDLEMWALRHKRIDHRENPERDIYTMSGYKEYGSKYCPICRDHRGEYRPIIVDKDKWGDKTYFCQLHHYVTAEVEADMQKTKPRSDGISKLLENAGQDCRCSECGALWKAKEHRDCPKCNPTGNPCSACPFQKSGSFSDCQWRPLCYRWKHWDVEREKHKHHKVIFHCNVCGQRCKVQGQTGGIVEGKSDIIPTSAYRIQCTKCNWASQWHSYAKNTMA